MKPGTIALVVNSETPNESGAREAKLLDTLSDEQEILIFEEALERGDEDPLKSVYDFRNNQSNEEEEFGNYVENLLEQPYLRAEVQQHALQWLRSKIRIEQYQRKELEASKVISDFAYKVYRENPEQDDFVLAGPNAQVRIRVFDLKKMASSQGHRGLKAA